MFSSFTWTNYFLLIGILLVIYVLIIGFLYYRKEINQLFFSKREAMMQMIDKPVAAHGDPLALVHELVSELSQQIRRAAEDKTLPAELLFAMQLVIKNYLILRSTVFQGRINQYIKDELTIRGLEAFSIEQYAALWND